MKNIKIYFWHNAIMDRIEAGLIKLTNYMWNQRRKTEKQIALKIKAKK